MQCFVCNRDLDNGTLARMALRLGMTAAAVVSAYQSGNVGGLRTRMIGQRIEQSIDYMEGRRKCALCGRYL